MRSCLKACLKPWFRGFGPCPQRSCPQCFRLSHRKILHTEIYCHAHGQVSFAQDKCSVQCTTTCPLHNHAPTWEARPPPPPPWPQLQPPGMPSATPQTFQKNGTRKPLESSMHSTHTHMHRMRAQHTHTHMHRVQAGTRCVQTRNQFCGELCASKKTLLCARSTHTHKSAQHSSTYSHAPSSSSCSHAPSRRARCTHGQANHLCLLRRCLFSRLPRRLFLGSLLRCRGLLLQRSLLGCCFLRRRRRRRSSSSLLSRQATHRNTRFSKHPIQVQPNTRFILSRRAPSDPTQHPTRLGPRPDSLGPSNPTQHPIHKTPRGSPVFALPKCCAVLFVIILDPARSCYRRHRCI